MSVKATSFETFKTNCFLDAVYALGYLQKDQYTLEDHQNKRGQLHLQHRSLGLFHITKANSKIFRNCMQKKRKRQRTKNTTQKRTKDLIRSLEF
jgi:hypothetical protein